MKAPASWSRTTGVCSKPASTGCWLAANGTVKPFDGDLADYGRFVLGADARPAQARKREPASPRAGGEDRGASRRRSSASSRRSKTR